jgi:hypothetical protein
MGAAFNKGTFGASTLATAVPVLSHIQRSDSV